jgi:alcohol dehydrogenase (NADP+)
MTANTKAYAAPSAKSALKPFSFTRRDPLPDDVKIDILFCGVCHSDIHTARDEWGGTTFPCVPGHEIVGRVVAVGRNVKKFKDGDLAAVGCMVDADRSCPNCRENLEQFCPNVVFTYNGQDKHSGGVTYGGYSTGIVVNENFVLKVGNDVDLAATAPLLCAGITTYSPLRHWKVGKGQKVGVVGLGGLGHMAVKFANAFGAEVTLFTTSPGKAADAKRFGAQEIVISKEKDAMEKTAKKFDFIIDTVSAQHDLGVYLAALKRDGTLVMVGASPDPLPLPVFNLIIPRRQIAGSLIGGIAETQEMLDFSAERGITCDIEKIKADYINEAYERMIKSDVKYRFVIDIASLK